MNPIGGYFELELPLYNNFPQQAGIQLNTGRNALEYVLNSIGDIQLLYLPYYTCSVVLEPLQKLGIPHRFYHINEQLELIQEIPLMDGEYLLYTNYFGIKDRYIQTLTQQYGDHLIVDNAQALYTAPTPCAGTIYSPRKFIGIPDGGIAYCSNPYPVEEQDYSHNRCSHLLRRIDQSPQEGYADFRQNSAKLEGQPIRTMSSLTERLIHGTDFEFVRQRRMQNYQHLHKTLAQTNNLDLPSLDTFSCPMAYPYLTDDPTLRQRLIENQVFVPTYWPNVPQWCPPDSLEHRLSQQLLALPIDQRYGHNEMNQIIQLI